ncbi:FecCD family ABC transporter permease [Nocardia callitridis]|uniref:FecCD family ABC transporter permease n=1 Tax=Nocardia callitridis TaxID=648753 RepID=UPI0031E7EA53
MPDRPTLRIGGVSTVLRPRAMVLVMVLAALTFALVCVDLGRGDVAVSVREVLNVLGGAGTRSHRFVVLELRLPRALTGVVAGGCLGLSGALTQSLLRNPLAAPDLLGVTSGAGAGAVLALIVGGEGLFGVLGVTVAALLGGLSTMAVVIGLAWRHGFDGFRIVLIGIGANAMLVAAITWLLTYADLTDATRAQVWLNGSLDAASWTRLWPPVIGLLVAGAVAVWSIPTLAVLRFGDDKARSLGVRLSLRQALVLLAAVAAAALATSACGPIGFIALAAPQIARLFVRSPMEPIVTSVLVGSALVVGGDIVARTVLPTPLPVGIVTSAAGGVGLLFLLVRARRKAAI